MTKMKCYKLAAQPLELLRGPLALLMTWPGMQLQPSHRLSLLFARKRAHYFAHHALKEEKNAFIYLEM